MSKFLSLVSRFGPLVAALAVGLGGLIATVAPEAKPFVDGFVAFLGLFGVQPDVAFLAETTSVVASAFLVYGGIRKLYSLFKNI